MQLPQDLKEYRAQNGFIIFTDGEALLILAVLLGGCFIADAVARFM